MDRVKRICTYRLCEQRRFRRACASAQSRQNLRCSLIQAVNQEEPSDRKPDPWPLWMAGNAQLKFDGMLEDTNSLDGAQIKYIMTFGMAFSPAPVRKKKTTLMRCSNHRCFYIDPCQIQWIWMFHFQNRFPVLHVSDFSLVFDRCFLCRSFLYLFWVELEHWKAFRIKRLQNDLYSQQRLISACASPQSDLSSISAQRIFLVLSSSVCSYAQTDLSFRLEQMSHSMTRPKKWRALSKDSDQYGRPPSLINLRCALSG